MADPGAPGVAGAAALVVMSKAPIPGFAKTRLAPPLGAGGAAALHAILVERTLRAALASGLAPVALWCAPDARAPFFAGLRAGAGHAVELHDQPAGDLGARMRTAFAHHLAGGSPAVMVGTDCPALAPEHLGRARDALAGGADAVLVPAEDGGYAAIGLARLDRSLFEGVPWGSAHVLEETRARLRRLGWRTHELAPLRDVDLPEDVDWLLGSGLLGAAERARLAPFLP